MGLRGLVAAAFLPAQSGGAADLSLLGAISTLLDFNRQEIAVLTTAFALLGFSVVAAILLMRSRVVSARNEARLRANIGDLQIQADSYRALLFAEPQILISWAAGNNRPQISGDISLLMQQDSPQRILAFGTWLPPEPALQIDHAVDALREAGEGFVLHLTASNVHTIEAMGRAIGGQASKRTRQLSRLTRQLPLNNTLYRAPCEQTIR